MMEWDNPRLKASTSNMSTEKTPPVQFTQRQYDYLNSTYPERAANSMSNDELRFYSGQRALVMFIGSKVQKDNAR